MWYDEETHPAFERILDDLAPDEARILMLLVRSGSPAQRRRPHRWAGRHGQLAAARAGPHDGRRPRRRAASSTRCRSYLNNLDRLGLVWLSREPVPDPMEYQVLEAQPDVLAAVHSVRFAKVVRRSIHLTPFGEDFCRTCLLEPEHAEELPVHQVPPEPPEPGTGD